MNKLDNQLHRLFRAAAKKDRPVEAELPFGFASRVLAGRRAFDEKSSDGHYSILCRRAVLCSCGVALLFLLSNLQAVESFVGLSAWHAPEVRLFDSALQSQMP